METYKGEITVKYTIDFSTFYTDGNNELQSKESEYKTVSKAGLTKEDLEAIIKKTEQTINNCHVINVNIESIN